MASFVVRVPKSRRPFNNTPDIPAVQIAIAGIQTHGTQGSDVIFMDDIQSEKQIDEVFDNLVAHLKEVRKDAKQQLAALHNEKLRNASI